MRTVGDLFYEVEGAMHAGFGGADVVITNGAYDEPMEILGINLINGRLVIRT